MVGTGVEKEIRNALQTRVPLPSGGYIYVQTTEALTVVDVNSGKFTSLESQEATILHTNMEAAKEIARQLRLRNIGGMIVVDFIDMSSRSNQLTVLQAFEEMMEKDKGKPQIGQLSDLGLVEMTRHRQGQSLSEIFTKKCLGCNGAMHVVEEFNWAPASSAGDYNRFGQQRFPAQRQQGGRPQQRGAGGNGNQQQGGPGGRQGVARPGDKTLQKYMSPQELKNPLRAGFLQQPSQTKTHDENELIKTAKLDEVFAFWILKKFGISFASIAKLASLPIELNMVVSRMNPKASDVFTLVRAIESSVNLTGDNEEDDDDDENEDTSDTNGNDASEETNEVNDAIGEVTEEVEEVLEVMNDDDNDAVMPHQFYDVDDMPEPLQNEENDLNEARYEHSAVAVLTPEHDSDEIYDTLDSENDSSDDEDKAAPTATAEAPRRRGRPPAKRGRKPNS